MLSREVLCHALREAIIVVLPKPGKDPLLPYSYRPISLINIDHKLLARVLATHLAKVVKELVHLDQSMALNIRLFLNIQLPVDIQAIGQCSHLTLPKLSTA